MEREDRPGAHHRPAARPRSRSALHEGWTTSTAAGSRSGRLLGELLLLDDDVRKGIRLPDGHLKSLSEAKVVTGERKYGRPFTFTVLTLPLLFCNDAPPSLADISHGMTRRLAWSSRSTGGFKKKEQNRTLFREISASSSPAPSTMPSPACSGWCAAARASTSRNRCGSRRSGWLASANPLPRVPGGMLLAGRGPRVVSRLYARTARGATSRVTLAQQRQSFRENLEHLGLRVVHGRDGSRVLGLSLCAIAAGAAPLSLPWCSCMLVTNVTAFRPKVEKTSMSFKLLIF